MRKYNFKRDLWCLLNPPPTRSSVNRVTSGRQLTVRYSQKHPFEREGVNLLFNSTFAWNVINRNVVWKMIFSIRYCNKVSLLQIYELYLYKTITRRWECISRVVRSNASETNLSDDIFFLPLIFYNYYTVPQIYVPTNWKYSLKNKACFFLEILNNYYS